MNSETNGWTNAATWNAALWLMQDGETHKKARSLYRDEFSVEAILQIVFGTETPDKYAVCDINKVEIDEAMQRAFGDSDAIYKPLDSAGGKWARLADSQSEMLRRHHRPDARGRWFATVECRHCSDYDPEEDHGTECWNEWSLTFHYRVEGLVVDEYAFPTTGDEVREFIEVADQDGDTTLDGLNAERLLKAFICKDRDDDASWGQPILCWYREVILNHPLAAITL